MTSLRHRLSTDTRYTLLGLPVSIVHFTVSVTGLSAGLGASVVFVGLPLLAGCATVARNLADFERVALPGVLDRPVARPPYPTAPAGAGWFRRMINPLAGGQGWIDLLHGVIAFPLSLAAAVVTAVWWAGAILGLTFPLYGWTIPDIPGFDGGLPTLLGLGDGDLMFIGFNTALGVLFALTLPPVVRGAALTKAALSQALLTRAPAAHTPAGVTDPRWV
ncbi:hypothetical protein GCM10022224_021290 [Nonomuraea antimicrobica]|uniref:Putative sensor domain-containing protein n=1 Tax=Nonomuraea antimicrobica TaxID=561173 RepID=A0ABP7BFI0_9ACTN